MAVQKIRLDESFQGESIQKSFTGDLNMSIDPEMIHISGNGNLIGSDQQFISQVSSDTDPQNSHE